MNKFNDTIKNYITEQGNIIFNPTAAKGPIASNPQLRNATDVMNTVAGVLIKGNVKQTPEEFDKALVAAFGVKTPEEAYKVLEQNGFFKKQDQTQQPEQTNPDNKPSTTTNTTQSNSSTVKAPESAYSTAPKA